MIQSSSTQSDDRLFSVIGYLILGAIAFIALSNIHAAGARLEAPAALLLLFGVLMIRMPSFESSNKYGHFYLIVQALLVTALMFFPPDASLYAVLFFILSAQAMILFPDRAGWLWILGFTVLTGVIMTFLKGVSEGLALLPLNAGGYLFFGVFAQALGRADVARRESQELLAELWEAHTQLQEYAARVEEMAVMEERGRLAREMHDTLGHRLTVAAVQLEGAQRLILKDPERAGRMVDTVRDQVRAALGELRRTVAALREPLETGLSLSRALVRLVTGFEEATGITVHRLLPEEMPDLPDGHRLTLYRAAQEALTNVQRHAQASDVWLQLTLRQETIALLVSDNGVGLPAGSANGGGFGLRGLQERAEQLGGALYLEPRPGGGTEVSLRLPLPGGLGGGDG